MAGRDWALLRALPEEDRRRVLAAARRRRFARGEVLFHEGDPGDTLHLLERGRVAVRATTPLGDVATLAVLGPGECFGEQALVAPDARRTASAVALEAAETLAVHRFDFEDLRRRHPSADRFLVEVLAAQVRRLSAHLVEALYVPAEARVLRRLGGLAELYGDGDGPATVPLTQEDLATMAGTTRPTANRVLRAAEEANLVRVGRGRIEVLDPAGLARRAR